MRAQTKKLLLFLIAGLSMGLLFSGCHSTSGSNLTKSKNQRSKEAFEEEAEEIQPLLIWGEDGVPIFNEEALSLSLDAETEADGPKKAASKSKRDSKKELLPEFVEKEKPKVEFTIKTNQPLSQAPIKTRMQEFYEFTRRLDRKHTVPLPDMIVLTDPKGTTPLFSEDELTSTNQSGEPRSLMSSFETKIRLVNENLKFVVLDYSYEPMPPVETRLSVYRGNSKIGLIKITGPIKDGSIVGIILEGTPQVGDTVLREIWH
ncbi:MAG: hypothetical protein QM428_04260 [Verrucomicrobiota bacterium]|jgi:hypothetical protein|nr:hypothetical protein [Verrucomicrobiota bacterium]